MKLKIVFGCLAIVLTILVVVFGIRIYQLTKASNGTLRNKNQTKSALIVLDIQNDTLKVPQYKNQEEIIQAINHVIQLSKNKKLDVIYSKQVIENKFDAILSGNSFIKDTVGCELSPKLQIESSNIFSKSRNDFFSNKDFSNYLIEQNIGHLYIVGADASACVLTTALSARNRDYDVTIINDCLFSIDQKSLEKSKKVYQKNKIQLINSTDFNQI